MYQLSYVNLSNGSEHYYDRDFASVADLQAFVAEQHPNASSYQIIVVLPTAAIPTHFISSYTDGPSTSWNVIDRRTQEWVRRFPTEEAAQEYADKLNAKVGA